MKEDDDKQTHPSYGLASFSRRTGNPGRLFGSPLPNHQAYVTLAIRTGHLMKETTSGQERYFGSIRGDLIEVDLSSAQFAELLTTMNVGLGVPCTIRYVNNKRVEDPPEIPQEVEKVRTHFAEKMKEAAQDFKEQRKSVEALLEKKSLSQADRKQIANALGRVEMMLTSSAPFYLEMFEESAQKVVLHAKSEIDAFVTHNVFTEGLKAIAERKVDEKLTLPRAPDGHINNCALANNAPEEECEMCKECPDRERFG